MPDDPAACNTSFPVPQDRSYVLNLNHDQYFAALELMKQFAQEITDCYAACVSVDFVDAVILLLDLSDDNARVVHEIADHVGQSANTISLGHDGRYEIKATRPAIAEHILQRIKSNPEGEFFDFYSESPDRVVVLLDNDAVFLPLPPAARAIYETKRLVDGLGGIDQARKALDELEGLQETSTELVLRTTAKPKPTAGDNA